MEGSQHVKSLSTDSRGKNRLRFSSSKQKSKRASADVYRSYERKIGVTSAASREERVHHPHQEDSSSNKRRRKAKNDKGNDKVAVLSNSQRTELSETSDDGALDTESTFESELDLARDRNSSEIFEAFYKDIWHLVRSLPEMLHHSSYVVDILLSYLLSPESAPSTKSPSQLERNATTQKRNHYICNHATTDILHLIAVMARDLRHEIHPFVFTSILPRIITDLLTPPPFAAESGKQPTPIDVAIVEACFRTISYIFRYDSEPLLAHVDRPGQEPCLEQLRAFYGATLGHKRDLVRRLAAETFAPLIRKLGSDTARKKHLKRTIRALASSSSCATEPTSHSLQRAQQDARDGIAWLLFQTARGVAGRMHSKAQIIIKISLDTLVGYAERDVEKVTECDVVFRVNAEFMARMIYHVHPGYFEIVWKELVQCTEFMIPKEKVQLHSLGNVVLGHLVQLLTQCIASRQGGAFKDLDKNGSSEDAYFSILSIVNQLMALSVFEQLADTAQNAVLDLLCALWKRNPNQPDIATQIGARLSSILGRGTNGKLVSGTTASRCAKKLSHDLLPHLPAEVSMHDVGSAILSSAGEVALSNPDDALFLVFSVASSRNSCENDTDNVFDLSNAGLCNITASCKDALLKICIVDSSSNNLNKTQTLARISYAARCIPFLNAIKSSDETVPSLVSTKMVLDWLVATLSELCTQLDKNETDGSSILVSASLVLEAFANTAWFHFDSETTAPWLEKSFKKATSLGNRLLFSAPTSLLVVKSVSSLIPILDRKSLHLNDDVEETFDKLTSNLRRKSHFLRLHTLQILVSFPRRSFVTDHAELDVADDLDEEPAFRPVENNKAGMSVSGFCDILDTLLQIESTQLSLHNERTLSSLLGRIEVLGRTGKLPVVYAEAVANFMLGILNLKFAPVWPAAVRVMIALASGHDEIMWQPLSVLLEEIMIPNSNNPLAIIDEVRNHMEFFSHHELFVRWNQSQGDDVVLFRDQVLAAQEEGRVSLHLTTDESTRFENVLAVLEGAPELLAKKSRAIVPIFLDFMHSQYFYFNSFDPDARELCLEKHVEKATCWERDMLRRSTLQKRLMSFLRAFAAVTGPKQLYKYTVLLGIFQSLLSHQEASVSQLALECVIKFKLPYVAPYSDHLRRLLKKGELREAMLNFDIRKDSDLINVDHRHSLLPIVCRILFGRLSSRASGGRTAKDTPAARRASVLSFLSLLDSAEFYPIIFLMTRSFVPKSLLLKPIEEQNEQDRLAVLLALNSINATDIAAVPDQRHEGFLNLLEAVLSQLGHEAREYVPTFISIILSLCKYSSIESQSGDSNVDENFDELYENGEGVDVASSFSRKGSIRSLCFRRLSDLFRRFSQHVDFEVYADTLWGVVQVSIDQLPAAVVNAPRPPALLYMLHVISQDSRLIPLLTHNQCSVASVIQCISPTSQHSVMNMALEFLDNLLKDRDDEIESNEMDQVESRHGRTELIYTHIPLLLEQFTERLGSKSVVDDDALDLVARGKWKKAHRLNDTTFRELSILCRVSALIFEKRQTDTKSYDQAVLESLCSLLLPFLDPGRRTHEKDMLGVLAILAVMIPKVTSIASLSYFTSLSRLLGPQKNQSGITSLQIRQSIASVIQTIAACNNENKTIEMVSLMLMNMCSTHSKRIDEPNYDELLPVLNSLSNPTNKNSWVALANLEGSSDLSVLAPLIYSCFYLLFDPDGVVNRGAFKSIKTLIQCSSTESSELLKGRESSAWIKLVESLVLPTVKAGLNIKDQAIRRYFVLLLADVSKAFSQHDSPHLYGDLHVLVRDDESDLDFFLNYTHVQLHRRSRSLQRLRTILNTTPDDGVPIFSMHSLSNILLPLAMHPIYESKTRLEESYALEGIATVGAISRHLSWSKYHSALWTTLNQLHRHPEQERYIVGMICSMLDAFHFEIENSLGDDQVLGEPASEASAVARALEKRVIPKIEALIVKEKSDRSGKKTKVLRPMVILALLKLFKRFPVALFESKLPRLLVVIGDGLRNKDSDARDIARTTLAKMAVEMGMEYFLHILKQLAIGLKLGYQLHVRAATLHTILIAFSEHYKPPTNFNVLEGPLPPFDQNIPAMMDLIQQDLFGEAREFREANANKKFVKEASGSKSNDSIEVMCRLLLFRPSNSTGSTFGFSSSIHLVVSPLLERLRVGNVESGSIGTIRECLNRVVVGVSHNGSVEIDEVLPFVYACVEPFIGKARIQAYSRVTDDFDSSDDDEAIRPIHVSQADATSSHVLAQNEGNHAGMGSSSSNVVEWRPSTLKSAKNSQEAKHTKRAEKQKLASVRDGASAPKMTGSGRHKATCTAAIGALNDPASISAVVFGLGLLHATLKKGKFATNDISFINMVDPFIPLLTSCVCDCRNNDVILFSLRCLCILMRKDLPSVEHCSKKLGEKVLDILSSAGAISNLQEELTQACFKTISLLIQSDHDTPTPPLASENLKALEYSREETLSKGRKMPLNSRQMQVLISMLKGAIGQSDHHNHTLSLIKAITSRRYMSSEYYDLMETILELSVRSHKATLRQQCSIIFTQYMIDYPMSRQKLEEHLRQIMLNIKYEYQEGRMSAIGLVLSIIEKLPSPLLSDLAQLFFLPLVLQLVNDDSDECREVVAKCIGRILCRAEGDSVQSLYNYTVRWSQGSGPLVRTSLQVFGLFVDSNVEILRRGDTTAALVITLGGLLQTNREEWEVTYFSLICLEKIAKAKPDFISSQDLVWEAVIECLANPHPWVKRVSSRMVCSFVGAMDVNSFGDDHSSFLVTHPGSLFEIATSVCIHIAGDEADLHEEISMQSIKTLTWIIQAMQNYPHLCFSADMEVGNRNPVKWLITRLSHIAKPKGPKRRETIFKCFAAFASVCGASLILPYLELMLEPLHRAETEADNRRDAAGNIQLSDESALAKDVLQVIAEACESEGDFLSKVAAVKTKARDKRDYRKQELSTQAITNPAAASERKIKKNEAEKNRLKRKRNESRINRGGIAKKRHL